MNIALVQCPNWARYMPPLPVAYICAVLRGAGHKVNVFDFNIEFFHDVGSDKQELWKTGRLDEECLWKDTGTLKKEFPSLDPVIRRWANDIIASGADIAAFSVVNTSQLMSMLLAAQLKNLNPSIKVVFGGFNYHFPYERERVLLSGVVDAVVLAEGELTVLELVDQLERYGRFGHCLGTSQLVGSEVMTYPPRPVLRNLDSLPFPDFTGFDLDKYASPVKKLPIAFSRGCVRRCTFCIEWIAGRAFRTRGGKDVFSEVCHQRKLHPEVGYFNFNDSLVNGDIPALREFVDLLLKADFTIGWDGNAIATLLMTSEFLEKIRKAGCTRLVYGIESGSQRVLDAMRKGVTIEVAEHVLRDTYEAGIIAGTNWIVGFPGETEEDFQATLDFIERVADYITVPAPWGSKSLILPGTTIALEPGKFGIFDDPHKTDWHEQWRSMNGNNTLEVREERYRRFAQKIKELGVKYSES